MEKRVLVAVVLSFLVLYLYQAFLAPPPPKRQTVPAAQTTSAEAQPAAGGATGPAAAQGGAASASSSAPSLVAAPAVQALVSEAEERDIVVETDVVRAVFTNRGARVKQWELKSYRDHRGNLVDLVPRGIAGAVLPFSLETGDGAVDGQLNSALYKVVADGQSGSKQGGRTIAFEYRDSTGLAVTKSFDLAGSTYTIAVKFDVSRGGTPVNTAVAMGPGLGDVQTSKLTSYSQKANGVVHQGGAVTRFDAKSIVAGPQRQGTWDYAGMDNHYFISVALLGGKTDAGIRYRHYWVAKNETQSEHDFVAYVLNPAGAGINQTFYLGPKEFDTLKNVDGNLVRTINFGMWAWLATPLLRALKGVDAYVHNYGWSIIVLTFLINLAIFPLRHKSFVSMRKMQALQPEVKAIQDRYGKLKASDPERQKMNSELMQVYKDRGVNPASGCVPMLLTMPILFAFYTLLSAAIELRGAPFMWWIKDLAQHDPLYITPILMGVTMLVQQRMTPSQADPVQQKMMLMMPLVFTGMFLWAPSGLVIYWFFSNVLAIAQQMTTNRMLAPVTAKDLRPVKK